MNNTANEQFHKVAHDRIVSAVLWSSCFDCGGAILLADRLCAHSVEEIIVFGTFWNSGMRMYSWQWATYLGMLQVRLACLNSQPDLGVILPSIVFGHCGHFEECHILCFIMYPWPPIPSTTHNCCTCQCYISKITDVLFGTCPSALPTSSYRDRGAVYAPCR